MNDETADDEPGYGRTFGLSLIGCFVHALICFQLVDGVGVWEFVAAAVSSVLLLLVTTSYAVEQGRHPAWGLLGVLNLFGLVLLLILPEVEASSEAKRIGFSVTRPVLPLRNPVGDDDTEVMMRVDVKLFAILRERAGTADLVLQLPSGATVADASARLAEKLPDLSPFLRRVAFAVNLAYAKADAVLHEGDELALIPPVSGG